MYWACCLRESWEELGLRPWRVEFLGLLPVYHLSLFNRKILPMVGWTSGTVDFRPNWEVSRIVRIPIPSLLRPESYAVYSLRLEGGRPYPDGLEQPHFPCFIHRDHEGQEVLWGATYHIVLSFLERVFGFQPPPASGRWIIQGVLPETYAADRDLP